MLAPFERFLAIESSSGVLLLLAALVAMAWASSPWHASYTALWHTPLGIELGPFELRRELHWWVNDGLMAVFFFVVGLEIRREMHEGALSDLRRAALPLAAALGGMIVPASIYAALNAGRPTLAGWGIPMATDIAFAVGVLTLLGRRVPPALRALLLALAVIDDVGAILVIALFYSSGIAVAGMALLALGVLGVLLLQWSGVRSPLAYVIPALAGWAGAYLAGVHPTLAGVILGLLTPVRPGLRAEELERLASEALLRARNATDAHARHAELDRLELVSLDAMSPAERLQHRLHRPVAFLVMPLFALANAGVPLGTASLEGDGMAVASGIVLGLVLGKCLGITSFAWLAVRSGLAALPTGVGFSGVALVGLVGGIGFTMSLFIAALALPEGPILETARLAILAASLLAAIAGLVVGRLASSAASAAAPASRRAGGD